MAAAARPNAASTSTDRDPAGRAGVISFNFADIHAHDLASILDTEGVCVRAGHHCTMPLMEKMGWPATARASFYLYNTEADVDALVARCEKAAEVLPGSVGTLVMDRAQQNHPPNDHRHCEVGPGAPRKAWGARSPGRSAVKMDDFYKEYILDHYRNPRNFGHLDRVRREREDSTRSAATRFGLSSRSTRGRVERRRFSGKGCAISQASASMLTGTIKGMTLEEVASCRRKQCSKTSGSGSARRG